MRRYIPLIVGVVLGVLCYPDNTWASDIAATVDRDPVRLDESFTLVFDADGSVDADPSFHALERDFDILHRSQSTNMNFINGQVSNTQQWTLVLMPKRLGELAIPSISFGKDQSPILRVTVISAQHAQPDKRSEDLFLEVDAEPRRTFVQAQILYTARLYRAVTIENATLTEPTLNDTDAVIKQLGEDRTFQTQRDDRRYQVVERRYVIFPQRSGTLTIDPVVFQGQIVPSRRSFFSPRSGQTKRVRSDSIALNIDPIPASYQGATWLPSQSLQLAETWPQNPPQFIVGEPVTRTLSVVAEGLTSAQLPVINVTVSPSIKQYPDQPVHEDKETHQGITAFRMEKVALIPSQPGRLMLPEIEIPWWNMHTNRMEVAKLPERSILVEPGLGLTGGVGNQYVLSPGVPTASPESLPPYIAQIQTGTQGLGIWPWLTGFLAVGWLVTGMLWWRYRHGARFVSRGDQQNVVMSRRSVERTLKQACESGNAQEAKAALLEWGKLQWPDSMPKTIGDIGERLPEPFHEELCRLNHALYGHESVMWEGEILWSVFEQSVGQETKTIKPSDDGLEPLWAT